MSGSPNNSGIGDKPHEGYFGTSRIRSGREIPVPDLFLECDYLSVADKLIWGVDESDCPVFGLDRSHLKKSWKGAGSQTIREDHNTPVVQIPGRFFEDFTGNAQLPEAVRQGPVREGARVDQGEPLHFIRIQRFGGAYIQLLTWQKLAELPAERINSLFPHLDQRIEFMSNVTYEDCNEYEEYVFAVLEDLFGNDVEMPIDQGQTDE